ncbi:MAG TPA: putative sulfate exporter family transporter [Holophagaceae bacterium]|nr:putative sulfate exporter family transporter [Holophagaceae bacterium]HJW32264.1 putative sulfate exporter family transporter [Holophagaceae bacterium]
MAWLLPLLGLICLLPGGHDLPGITLPWPAVPSWLALLLGLALALGLGHPHGGRTKVLTPKLLSVSVIGLGAAMNLQEVARVGLQGFAYTVVGISLTLILGLALGRWLKVQAKAATLIAVGTAICGGSAIAAAAPVLEAEDEDLAMALGTVFLLNASALLIFPAIGHLLHMPERGFGLWSALAIHDTSSVVGASNGYGAEAVLVATTTKLARALWIVPLTLALGARAARSGHTGPRKTKRPWFILGFLAMAALVTYLPALKPAGTWVSALAKRSLVLTLFLIGAGISREALQRVGLRPFLQGLLLWILVGGGTLAAIQAHWIR